jgi:outer membrane protein assembly factor BamB
MTPCWKLAVAALMFAVCCASSARSAAPTGAQVEAALGEDPFDWPRWRGPAQNGQSIEKNLPDKWDLKGAGLLWKNDAVQTRSTPIVLRGKVYLLSRSEPGTPREGEKVICIDAATGDTLWEVKFNVYLSDVPDTRVGGSNCVADPKTGRVYAMGVNGYMLCLDGATGKIHWNRSLMEEFGLLSTYGGRTNVPVLFEDLVITSAVTTGWGDMARPAHRFIAMHKETGEVVWISGTTPLPDDTTYSTPILATIDGQALMVFGSGDGYTWGLQPRTGKPVWKYRTSLRGVNLTPLVVDDTVYIGHSEENFDDSTMGGLLAFRAQGEGDLTGKTELWRFKERMIGRSTPILVDGRLYAADDSGKVYVLDPATGEEVARPLKLGGTIMRSSLSYADGKIYACTTSVLHVLQPTENGLKILDRVRLPDGEEVYATPVVSHGRLYFATTSALYCLGKKDASPEADPVLDVVPEAAPVDPKPAWVQVTPVESIVGSGQNVQLRVRLFNARGEFLKESPAEYAVEGSGAVDAQGLFAPPATPIHSAALVTATVDGLKGTARVRIVPPLPWRFEFVDVPLETNMKGVAEGEPPITWIGARYRHKIRELEGRKVMVKVTTIPKGTRSQSWMGPTDLSDYTIQADVRGAVSQAAPPAPTRVDEAAAEEDAPAAAPVIGEQKLPDIGLIAQRYTLDLMGASQQLQIRSWTATLARFSKNVPFAWSPDTWYTLKFRASTEGGQAVLRGKCWPRGEPEPAEWQIEAVDAEPNLNGSPGLFGNATNAEIYIDNVIVTEN